MHLDYDKRTKILGKTEKENLTTRYTLNEVITGKKQ